MMSRLLDLLVLGIPVACVSWTVTHEKVFEPARQACEAFHKGGNRWEAGWKKLARYLAYASTCEYCFSHYVALVAVHVWPVSLLGDGFMGRLSDWFALVWVANIYMNVHFRLRLSIKLTGARAKEQEKFNEGFTNP